MNVHPDRYKCIHCDKVYSSASSLWNHNSKFHDNKNNHHNQIININNPIPINNNQPINNEADTTKQCRYCKKIFSHYNNKWRHEKKCKEDKFFKLQEEYNKLKKEKNIKPVNNNNINNQNINNGSINNGTINNIVINQVGSEKIESLPFNDILKILSAGNNMPITCIKNLNFNKDLPENHSFCATTLEGKHFTRINHETQKPEKINKVDFINEVLQSSLNFLNNISLMAEFDESFRDKIPIEYQNKMKEILANQEKFHDPKNKKAFFNCINDMSYNFKNLILETWKLIQPVDDDEPPLLDENYKYWSSDDEIEINKNKLKNK